MFWVKIKNKLLAKKIGNTLKGKLSLWYLTSIGLTLLLFMAIASGLFWTTLEDQIDHHIHIVVNEAYQVVQNYQKKERDSLIKNLVSAQGMTVVVLSPDGTPVLETNSPDVALVTEHVLQKILASTSLKEQTPIHFTENGIRFAAMPVQVDAGKGIVAVGYSTRILYSIFYKMIMIMIAILVLLVLPITLIGYRLLKKHLRPLESIAKQAKSVSSLSLLSKKIYIPSPTEELKTIQEALNLMLNQLEYLFKNERKFFSDAAHTLKTPLAVLLSQVENSPLGQKSKKELLATINEANSGVADLLFLSKIGSRQQKTLLSLSDLMIDLSELATALGAKKRLKVLSSIQKNIKIKAEAKLLQRALSNIIHNAVVYNKPKGNIYLSLKKELGLITLVIKDSGRGIKKSDRPQVFKRFFRGSNVTERGSGLGLSIACAVIENMGGKISLFSRINKGTSIRILFKKITSS